jgi:hypothetical protein
MWEIKDTSTGVTNSKIAAADGIISVTKPDSVSVKAYVNGAISGVHHVHVKAGDTVYFKLKGSADSPELVTFDYEGETSNVLVPADTARSAYSEKENGMTPMETVNLFANPNQGNMGGALGGGLGAGLVGGLLGTMIFRNGGLNGIDGGGIAPVAQVVNDSAVLTTLGDIKASVPLAEAQVQLALAGVQTAIISDITSQTNSIAATQSRDALATANGFASVNSNVSSTASITQKAVADASLLAERNAWAVTQAITNDGDRTRALIQSIDKSNDSRLITSQANEIVELRGDRRLQEATGNITISNTNTANAVQSQNQQQQQFQILANLNAQLGNLANDIQAVRQSSVVFNSGTQTGSGNQSAANTRVA